MAENIRRPANSRMIAGVAAGLAEYFDISPVIIRLLFILSFFAWGASLFIYIILWIIMPDEKRAWEEIFKEGGKGADFPHGNSEIGEKKKNDRKTIAGLILIFIGSLMLFDDIFHWLDFGILFAISLVAVGAYLLAKEKKLFNKTG